MASKAVMRSSNVICINGITAFQRQWEGEGKWANIMMCSLSMAGQDTYLVDLIFLVQLHSLYLLWIYFWNEFIHLYQIRQIVPCVKTLWLNHTVKTQASHSLKTCRDNKSDCRTLNSDCVLTSCTVRCWPRHRADKNYLHGWHVCFSDKWYHLC